MLVVKALIIWAILMMFNRMRVFSTAIVVVMFVILYMVKALRDYNKQECKVCDKKVEEGEKVPTEELVKKAQMEGLDDTLHDAERGLILGLLANVGLGTYLYLGDKQKEYGDEFDWTKFVLGVQKCKSAGEDPSSFRAFM